MNVNEGTLDRSIRVLVGIVVRSLVFVGPTSPYALLGLVPLVTGLVGYCPTYRLLGISTKRSLPRSRAAGAASP